MIPLYILKIGGSVATYKNRLGFSARRSLIKKISRSIKKAREEKNFNLILIHGAGAAGHQLAHQYNLKDGTGSDESKWHGALLSRIANQRLNNALTETFISEKLQVTPIHTASIIIQKNKKIELCHTEIIREAICQNCIPLLYGEMVFDTALGMSICSGDTIAPYLAQKLKAQKIFFASDIDGIFDQDPHRHKNATLIKKAQLQEIQNTIKLSESHNIDVTGGLLGKIECLSTLKNTTLKSIEIFNGLHEENYLKVFLEEEFPRTIIKM